MKRDTVTQLLNNRNGTSFNQLDFCPMLRQSLQATTLKSSKRLLDHNKMTDVTDKFSIIDFILSSNRRTKANLTGKQQKSGMFMFQMRKFLNKISKQSLITLINDFLQKCTILKELQERKLEVLQMLSCLESFDQLNNKWTAEFDEDCLRQLCSYKSTTLTKTEKWFENYCIDQVVMQQQSKSTSDLLKCKMCNCIALPYYRYCVNHASISDQILIRKCTECDNVLIPVPFLDKCYIHEQSYQ